MELKLIAHIHTDFPEKFGIPRQSNLVKDLTGTIVFEPEYRRPEALRGLDGFDYLWLIWGFQGTERDAWNPTVRPPRLGGNERMGVFATRSPFRPNALGLSSVRIMDITQTAQGPVITVSGIDMRDGTPIYDIKPYLPYVESHPGVRGGFAEAVQEDCLAVDFPEALLLKIPAEKREALTEVLRQDPRPHYQNDVERIYGFYFAGFEIHFRIEENQLTVTSVEQGEINANPSLSNHPHDCGAQRQEGNAFCENSRLCDSDSCPENDSDKSRLPDNRLYGDQTARALENFALGTETTSLDLIYAIVTVKKAAIRTYRRLKQIDDKKAAAVIAACDEILSGAHDAAFPTHPLQGGAGTSTNMNVNEVIANLALEKLGEPHGRHDIIHPLDFVNKGQSTNDVYPTALRIAAINGVRGLSDACAKLQESLQKKENEFEDILKLGRTELMDALPITLGQEFGAYAQAIARDRWRIYKVEERLRQINLGGTAVGTGSNADRKYSFLVLEELRGLTGIGLARAEYPMDLTQNNDVFVEVSGLLTALAVNLMKICNDLRLMNSGPNGGFGEITLAKLQAGSTIMPGKVNPVIPEMVSQVAIQVMANDSAIGMCAASGQFELNAFLPLIADKLLESLSLLTRACDSFRTKCIDTLKANEANCRKHLEHSLVLVTALAPAIGYEKAAEISNTCNGNPQKIRELVLRESLLDEDTVDALLDYRRVATYRS